MDSLYIWESRLIGLKFLMCFESPFLCSIIILASFHSIGIFYVSKISLKTLLFVSLISVHKYHDITCQIIYAQGLVVFHFFFVFFFFFSSSDVMIDGTSDESGLVFFSDRCWSWGGELNSYV